MDKPSSLIPEYNKVPGEETLDEQITESSPSSAPASTTRSDHRPSGMLREILAATEDEDTDWGELDRRDEMAFEEAKAQEREGKEVYFFYGSLMDPWVLQ